MKLSKACLDLKSLVLGAVVGGAFMLSVGAGTTTGSPTVAKWDYKGQCPKAQAVPAEALRRPF